MITVVVTEIRPLPTDDGALVEITFMDQATGRFGTSIVSEFRIRELLGDCLASDLVTIDVESIVWK